MAHVFLAHDTKHGRRVAIKVLRPDLSAVLGTERFLREIRVASQLQHPHILPLYDSGQADGLLYYLMPFVEGESLRDRLDREVQLSVPDAVRIALDVAGALAYAHGQGVIHRDIKPENILLTTGQALVADFGIARAVEEAGEDRLTGTGLAIGTPAYMSPEQAGGDGRVDQRTDIYALGCVLFEMLAGTPPFSGRTPQAVLARHQLEAPPEIRVVRPTVDTGIAAVIERALAKVPADRFATVEEMAQALRGVAVPRRRAGRWGRTGRLAVAGGVMGVALVWAGGVLGVGGSRDHAGLDTTVYAVLPFVSAMVDGQALDETRRLRDAMSRWSGIRTVGLPTGEVAAPSARRAPSVARRLDAGRYIHGSASAVGDSVRIEAGLHDAGDGRVLAQMTARVSRGGGSLDSAFAAIAEGLLLRDGVRAFVSTETRSLPALQAYAAGHRALGGWDLAAADSAFAAAIGFDGAMVQGHLWLALVRAWQGRGPASWVVAARQVQSGRDRLEGTDELLADAVIARAGSDLPGACAAWRAVVTRVPDHYVGWNGLARCLLEDDGVVRDPSSRSGWRFRTSYHEILRVYGRAFELHPAILAAFQPRMFEGLRRVYRTGGNHVRVGVAVVPDTGRFVSMPALVNDTLAFVPYRREDLSAAQAAMPPAHEDALRRLQRDLHRVALTWASAAPDRSDAMEALAIALWMDGNVAALDTLARARSLATEPAQRVDLACAEAWMELAFGLPHDLTRLARARTLADSLVSVALAEPQADPLLTGGLAALTGRTALAVRLARDARVADRLQVPPELRPIAQELLVHAALGGPVEALVQLEHRVADAINAAVLPADRAEARMRWMARPATLAFPTHRFASLDELVGAGDYLLDMQGDWARRDTAAVLDGFESLRRLRQNLLAATITFDALFPEATLLAQVAGPEAAIRWLDPVLGTITQKTAALLTPPEHAAAFVRTMALRARLAAQMGDSATAAMWSRVVVTLWSDADPHLQVLVRDLRELS